MSLQIACPSLPNTISGLLNFVWKIESLLCVFELFDWFILQSSTDVQQVRKEREKIIYRAAWWSWERNVFHFF